MDQWEQQLENPQECCQAGVGRTLNAAGLGNGEAPGVGPMGKGLLEKGGLKLGCGRCPWPSEEEAGVSPVVEWVHTGGGMAASPGWVNGVGGKGPD